MPDMNPMQIALEQAKLAHERGEVPVGAVVVERKSGKMIAACHNLTETRNDPTCHAELLAMREAANKIGQPRLEGYDLYVTLEPCTLCAAAIALFRPDRLYFGAYDAKGGGVEHGAKVFDLSTTHHRPEIYGGINEQECGQLLKDFFASKRQFS